MFLLNVDPNMIHSKLKLDHQGMKSKKRNHAVNFPVKIFKLAKTEIFHTRSVKNTLERRRLWCKVRTFKFMNSFRNVKEEPNIKQKILEAIIWERK